MKSGEVGGGLPSAADSSEADRPEAVKAHPVAPPLRGFGLDGMIPPRFGLSEQQKRMGAHTAPNPHRFAYTKHVLGNGCGNARAVDRKALEGHTWTALASA